MAPRVILIAAVDADGGIGRDNELLVRLPDDMARFKARTMGHPVLMGRRTWDSIPPRFRPLTGRRNLVLSRQIDLQLAGAEVVGSLTQALAVCADAQALFVMGGAAVYAQALPLADELDLTEIQARYPADAHFPRWSRAAFRELSRECPPAPRPPGEPAFAWVRYGRTDAAQGL